MNISFQKAARKTLATGLTFLGISAFTGCQVTVRAEIDDAGIYECENPVTNAHIQFNSNDVNGVSIGTAGKQLTVIDLFTGQEVTLREGDGWCDCVKVSDAPNTSKKSKAKNNGLNK